jgi:dihydroorotate dehydrogenase electron transfer subunit
MTSKSHRGTIFLEDAEVIEQAEHPGRQYILRVRAPKCARTALPGSFAHVCCDPAVPMRRPLSIMRTDPQAGWVEFLYKIVGEGLGHLSTRRPGDRLSILGPIGKPFALNPDRSRPLLIGGGVGIPPMLFVAEDLHSKGGHWEPFVIMGSELPFPFPLRKSTLHVPGVSDDATHGLASLEMIGIPSRLASWAGLEGVHKGFVTDLARRWLDALSDSERDQVDIMACGPTPMLRAVAQLARDYSLPCQVSLEEFMACAVGGCAGCTVAINTEDGVVMKRVCVDGPVFEARSVFPPAA